MKILIGICHEEMWDFLSRRLRRRGFEVVVATDGQEVVDKSRTEAPDIVVVEVNLPTIDAWTAICTMRDDSVTAAMPIIALVGPAIGGDSEKFLAARYTDTSPWPINFSNLLSKIEQYGPKP